MTTPNPPLAATPTVEEALRALDVTTVALGMLSGDHSIHSGALRAIRCARAFVEAAAKEQVDWAAIEAWLGDDDERDCHIGPSAVARRSWTCRLVTTFRHGSAFNVDECATRAEALSAAATWCKKEMGQNG